MHIIGVDPGKSGAAAYIETETGELVGVFSFDKEIENCRQIHKYEKLASMLFWSLPTYFIEKVNSSPRMGRVSAFTFGKWTEAVECTAKITKHLGVHMVQPKVWQQAVGVASGGDKSKLFARAKELFPVQYREKMFNKASSDAVLLAYYGYRHVKIQELNQKEDNDNRTNKKTV